MDKSPVCHKDPFGYFIFYDHEFRLTFVLFHTCRTTKVTKETADAKETHAENTNKRSK